VRYRFLLGRQVIVSVRAALLGLLAQRPRHGYELHAEFEALVGGPSIWDVKPAQVYTTLSRLEGAGLVVQTVTRRVGGPDQRIFEITDAGRAELDLWYATGVHPGHQRDEVFLKIVLALADGRADALAVIHRQRTTLYRDLHALATARTSMDGQGVTGRALLLDKAIMHIEADLRWLEMAEARLHDMAAQRPPEGGKRAGATVDSGRKRA